MQECKCEETHRPAEDEICDRKAREQALPSRAVRCGRGLRLAGRGPRGPAVLLQTELTPQPERESPRANQGEPVNRRNVVADARRRVRRIGGRKQPTYAPGAEPKDG